MDRKVLVKLIVPEIDQTFDVFLPVNKKIGNIINLLNHALNEMTGYFTISDTNQLYNALTKTKYEPNILLAQSDIRNGTTLVLIQ